MFFINNCVFVLGASDPEMAEIETVLVKADLPLVHATGTDGKRVRPGNAYQAVGPDLAGVKGLDVSRPHSVARVECGWDADKKIRVGRHLVGVDHHRPGDPGYGKPPEAYWEASSLGQVCALLGIPPTPQRRIIAAADHCLMAAYRGGCPGVNLDKLSDWRLQTRANFQKRPLWSVTQDVQKAMEALRRAPKITIAGVPVADLGEKSPPETPEASARVGMPFIATLMDHARGARKTVLQSAPPEVIQEWMATCGLVDVYGDPARGLAGGYEKK